MQPYNLEHPVQHGLNKSFFTEWGARLQTTDADMIQQIAVTGAEGRSACELDTVVFSHHSGLRSNYAPARASVAKDTERGWMRAGRRHLWTVPCRVVPKNVVPRWLYKLVDGVLQEQRKWRVTTDDSISPSIEGVHSRNESMPRGEWADMSLPTPQMLGEAVAIVRSRAQAMGIRASARVFEQIALWALDLSDAYREIECQRSELWQQSYVWYDGVRLDTRCVFGSAHMPGFFQRVSSFVLMVAAYRIKQYDAQHPYGTARRGRLGLNGGERTFRVTRVHARSKSFIWMMVQA
jgi:hypothetical protein